MQFLNPDPTKRLQDIEVIKSHPFFQGFNWDTLSDQVAPLEIEMNEPVPRLLKQETNNRIKKILKKKKETQHQVVESFKSFGNLFKMNRNDLLNKKNQLAL